MATRSVYPPPRSTQNDPDDLGTSLDEQYLSTTAQQTGKQNYQGALEDFEAQELLSCLLGETQLHIQHVREKLVPNGDVILNRYSHEKRAVLLRESWGDISNSWLQLEAFKLAQIDDPWDSKRAGLGAIKWLNSANIDEFSQDRMRMMSLLHLRSVYEPHQWAVFDTRSAHQVFTNGPIQLKIPYNDSAVIMHGKAYGTVKNLDTKAAHSWAEAGFPRAYITFVVQRQIALWLHTFVDKVVLDATPSGNSKWTAMLAGGLRSSHEEVCWSPYHSQEFAPPSGFDLDDILRKARDHLNMLADEMELLQTSPEQMRQYVLEVKANTCFNYDGTKSEAEEWKYITRQLAIKWTNEICRWQRMVAECEYLKTTAQNSGSALVPGTRLSQDTATAMRSFGIKVHGLLGVAACEWQSCFRAVNIMQEHLIRGDQLKKNVRLRKSTDQSEDLDPTYQSDRVLHWAENMAQAIIDRKPGGVSWHVRKVSKELEGAAYSRGFDNWMSGLALMDGIALLWSWRQTIDHYNPQDAAAGVRSRDMLPSTFEFTSKQTMDALWGGKGDRESGELLRRFCELPLPKGPKDLAWLEKMTNAREGLTDVWTSIRKVWNERQAEIERSETMRQAVLSQMSFDLSPEHLARVGAERQQIKTRVQSAKALKERGPQFVQQAWDLGADNDNVVRRNLPKKANAARKDTAMAESACEKLSLDNSNSADSASPSVPKITVKQDSLSVISKMFPNAVDGSSSVRWTQLVQALTDAGLTATQGAGSAVSFAGQHGSVTMHQPHPEPVVDAIRLRAIGRRLCKWFGWNHETFALREKGDTQC